MGPISLPFPTEISLADALIALVLGLYVLEDLRRGFLFGLLSLVGFLVALVAALAFYVPLAGWLVEQTPLPYALAKPAAFALIWIVSDVVLAATLRRALAGPALAAARSSLGRLLGVATGLARAVLALTLALSVITALPLPEPVAEQIRASRLASYLVERGAGLQQAVAGVVEGAVGETLAVLTVRPESGERVDLRFTVSAAPVDERAEARMLELVNAERAKAGLRPLELDPAIRGVARDYSAQMFLEGYFAHVDTGGGTPFERMRRGGVRFSAAGENLALAPTVDVAHEGLMNSPGHRANILNRRFNRVGIGVADGGMHGKMFTQNFAD